MRPQAVYQAAVPGQQARGKADVLQVADAFEVMRKVNALLTGK